MIKMTTAGRGWLTGANPDELYKAIREDYSALPVPRSYPPDES
jgi:hypothetical protein